MAPAEKGVEEEEEKLLPVYSTERETELKASEGQKGLTYSRERGRRG